MNKVWKSFFSKKLGRFVVASENARSSTKANKSKNAITVAIATIGITFSTGALAVNDVDVDSTAIVINGDGNSVSNSSRVKINGDSNTVNEKVKTKVVGDYNRVTGTDNGSRDNTIVVGDQNAVLETDTATVFGDQNELNNANDSVVVGSKNKSSASSSIVVGMENELTGVFHNVNGAGNYVEGYLNIANGSSNTVVGENLNVMGIRNDVNGMYTVTHGNSNFVNATQSNVIGGSNSVKDQKWYSEDTTAWHVNVLGGSNNIKGSSSSVVGHQNITHNIVSDARNYTRQRIDQYLLQEEFSNNSVYNSAVLGSENRFGGYSYLVGDQNVTFGDYNSIVGLQNEIYGGYNSIIGRNNSMGRVTQIYDEISDSSDVVKISADNNKVVGDDNIIQGSYINILGSSNLTQNVEEHRPMLMAMGDWDSFNLSEYYYSDGVYNSNITGNENIYGSDSNLLGNENRIYGGNNNAVGNYNRNYGTANFIAGNNNEIGYYYTDWLYDEENDRWGNYTQFQENNNNSILGNANRITGNYATIVGEKNTIDADYVNIQGHNNRAQASSYMEETREKSRVDLSGMNLNEYYNSPAFSSNVMGRENVYGELTNILGTRNELYGFGNSAVGNENYVYGELNNAFGQNNKIGQISGGYEYDPEQGYYTNRETLKEVFGNNVMGYQNGVNGDDNSIIGNNNMSVGSVSIIQPQPQAMFMNELVDRPSLHKEMGDGEYIEMDNSNSVVVGNWNKYSEMSGILGSWNSAFGYNNTITGSLNNISGEANFVGGYQNEMRGTDTIIVGNSNSIYDSRNNTVVGSGNSLESVEMYVRETPPEFPENIESEMDLTFNQLMNLYRYTVEMQTLSNDGMYLSEKNILVGDGNGVVGKNNAILGSENTTGGWSGENNNPNTLEQSVVAGFKNYLSGLQVDVFGSHNNVEGMALSVVGSQNEVEGFLMNVHGQQNRIYGVGDGTVIGNMNELEGKQLYVNGSKNTAFVEKAIINGTENQISSYDKSELGSATNEITVNGFNNSLRDTHNSNFVGSRNNFEGSNLNVMGNGNSSDGLEGLNQGVQDSNIIGNNNLVSGKVNVIGQDNVAIGILPEMAESPEQAQTLLYGLDNISNPATTVIGSGNQAAFGSIAIGEDNIAVMGGIAIGNNTVASLGNIAIGANAIADGSSLSNDAYFIDGVAKYELAIANAGEDRRITGVAAGANANDAVNVEQLAAVFDNLDGRLNGVVMYDRDPVTGETLTEKVTLAGEKGTIITNVANAVSDSDAVNLGQVNDELALRDEKISLNTQNILTNTQDIAINSQNISNNTASIVSINESAVFFGRDASNSVDKSKLVLGDEGVLTQVKNVAWADDKTDAINLGQAESLVAGLDFGGIVRYDFDATKKAYVDNKITLANSTTIEMINIGGKLIDGTTDQYEGGTNVSVVKDGGTIISNIGTAKNADEAVNKGLLDSEIAKISDEIGGIKGAIQYEILESGDVNYGVSILKGDTAVIAQDSTHAVDVVESGGTKIKNVANAEFADEAINLGQLNLAIASLNDTYGEATLGAVQYDINDGVVNYAKARLRGDTASIVTDSNNIDVVEKGGTVIANVANATKADEAVNLGVLQSSLKPVQMNVEENTTDINTINRVGVFFGSNMNGAVNKSTLILGDASTNTLTQIKNVANAESRTDAINYGQVIDMFGEIPTFESLAGVVKYDRDANSNEVILGKVTLGGDKAELGADVNGIAVVTSGGTTLANVATAQNADEAVNKGQMESELAKRDQVIQLNTDNIVINQSNIAINQANILNIQETGVFFERNQFGATDYSKLILGNGFGSTQIKNVANASDRTDAVNYGQVLDMLGDVATEADLAGVVKYEQNEDGSYNKNSLVLSGDKAELGKDQNGTTVVTSGGTTISNVANAKKADEAINKGQFDSAINDLLGSTVQYDRNEDGSVNKDSITLGGTGGTTITNVANGKIEIGSTDAVNGGQIAEILGSIEIPEQLVTQDPNTKEINVATNKDGKVVNVNGTEGDRVIAGVADGKVNSTSNEAITGKQLNSTNNSMAQFLGGNSSWNESTQEFKAPTYKVDSKDYKDVGSAISALDARDQALDSKINNLEQSFTQQINATNNHIKKVEKRLSAGIAQAMAMESAPYVAGKLSYAVGAAHHGGENAVGATFRLTSESGKWSVTTGFAGASEGDASVRVGISGVIN